MLSRPCVSGEDEVMPVLKESLLAQLDGVLDTYRSLPSGGSGGRADAINTFVYSALSAVERATGADSSRSSQARKCAETIALLSTMDPIAIQSRMTLGGLVQSVRNDVEAGYLDETQTLIRAEVFDNLLEQAEYLLGEGYKDPAAVICGGVLESHLRNLCAKHGVDTAEPDGRIKKADKMNADLVKAKTLSVLAQKEVTAWLGLRNSAAHAKFDDYDTNQVKTMIQGVRGFIERHPA